MAATEHITSSETTFDHLEDMGIYVCVPKGALTQEEEPLDLHIRPCLCGRFELPSEYDPASPAYLIEHSKNTNFQKDIIIKIHHYASLQSKKDCEDMTFLSASSTPEYRESLPVYTFKKISGAKDIFRPGDQVGQIALRHFCLITAGQLKPNEEDASDDTLKGIHVNHA